MNVGSHIGQYRILRKLGAGGMGAVYLGEHILLGRRAAIKTLLPALSANREIVERFFNEARATSAISDPGVVQVFDFGYHVDGTAYIVLELLEGEALSSRIERLGQLPIADALRIARQAAASLASAHERGIVHRDLKPENIFLIRDAEAQGQERTKILDFGICKLGSDGARITASGATVGTPVYMSPEQCRGISDEVDHRADIYALGCVLFHMLTGRAPFEHDAPGEFLVSHMKEQPPKPSDLVPALPPMIDALVDRCLAKAPADRFQSMTELQAAIEHVLKHISAPGTHAPVVRPALALGPGYRSVYDANEGTPSARGRKRSDRLSDSEVASLRAELRPGRRFAIGIAIVGVLAGAAVIARRVTVGSVDAVAQPTYRYTSPLEVRAVPAPPPVEVPPTTVPAEPASSAVSDDVDVIEPPLEELLEEAAPAPVDPPPRASKRSSTPKRAAARKRTPPKKSPTEATAPTEDLYDTR